MKMERGMTDEGEEEKQARKRERSSRTKRRGRRKRKKTKDKINSLFVQDSQELITYSIQNIIM